MKKNDDRSWKNLQQKPRWTRQRVWGVLLRACVCLGLVSVIGFGLRKAVWKRKTVQPLEQVYFSTDGVLQKSRLLSDIKIPFGQELMTVDLTALQRRCLRYKQIETVHITREFPNALRIRVKEHQPCAKMLLTRNGRRSVGLVSSEGVIFESFGYDRQKLKTYPTVSDVPKTLIKDGKIVGFSIVFRLLQFLDARAPDVFQAIRGLSLKRFDPFLEKKYQSVELDIGGAWTLVFPIEQPEEALVKLRSILRSLSPQQRQNVRRLNVAQSRPTIEFL